MVFNGVVIDKFVFEVVRLIVFDFMLNLRSVVLGGSVFVDLLMGRIYFGELEIFVFFCCLE